MILTIFIVVRGFLAAVMKGQIPDELVKEAKGGEVNVDMEDHRDEEFVKPKVSARPFQGAGMVTKVYSSPESKCWCPLHCR